MADATPQLEPVIIAVNRVSRPRYPDWMGKGGLLYPELEGTGPARYDLAAIELWQYETPEPVKIVRIVRDLESGLDLANHIELLDLEAIRSKGLPVYRRFYEGLGLFALKSAIRSERGSLNVPFLAERDDELVIEWLRFREDWDLDFRALRFSDALRVPMK